MIYASVVGVGRLLLYILFSYWHPGFFQYMPSVEVMKNED